MSIASLQYVKPVTKFVLIVLSVAGFTGNSFATVFSNLNETRQLEIVCLVATAIKKHEAKTGQSFAQKLDQVGKRLKELGPLASIYQSRQNMLGTQQFLFWNEDYFTDLAFADFNLVKAGNLTDDWFGAYAFSEFVRGN